MESGPAAGGPGGPVGGPASGPGAGPKESDSPRCRCGSLWESMEVGIGKDSIGEDREISPSCSSGDSLFIRLGGIESSHQSMQ